MVMLSKHAHPLARITKGPGMNFDKIFDVLIVVSVGLVIFPLSVLGCVHIIKLIILALS
jgi:hypothetical protein